MMVRQNKWRAARFGTRADLVDSYTFQIQPVSDVVENLVSRLRPMAETLGCVDLRWQVPLAQGSGEIALPGHAGAATMIQYVFPTLQDQQHD